MKNKKISSVIIGAAFLMATSAVGPGFLTQTASFTKTLGASFGFVILISVIIDICAQLNIWRILCVSGMRAQDVANKTLAGSGYFLAGLVALGGLIFNIGNIGGAGLGFNVLFGLDARIGAVISAAIAIWIFVAKDAGKAMDWFVKILGFMMMGLIVWVVIKSRPPVGQALYRTFFPATIDPFSIVTLVGGTVGGYITFAGAHRLIDAEITGEDNLSEVTASAATGIALTAIIRYMLFLAAFGVLALGFTISTTNPPASVFELAAGQIGYKLFGIVMWAASITSVIGAAYTSVSFLKTFGGVVERRPNIVIILFIVFSTLIFTLIGNPVKLLIFAGTFNGFILPLGLSIVLLASRKKEVVGDYHNPLWLTFVGWFVVAIMTLFSLQTFYNYFVAS